MSYVVSSKAKLRVAQPRGGRGKGQRGEKRREVSPDTPGNKTFRLDVTSPRCITSAKRRESASGGEHESRRLRGERGGREREKGSGARTEREELRGALCVAEVQVADSPLFEHAVNLLPLLPSLPRLHSRSRVSFFFFTSFSLPLDPLPRIQARARALMLLKRMCARCVFMRGARAPRGGYARFMRVRATTLVHAVKFISIESTHLSVVGEILLSPWCASRATDEYRQVLAFSPFLSLSLCVSLSLLLDGIFTICVLLILLDSVRKQFNLVRSGRDMKASLLRSNSRYRI